MTDGPYSDSVVFVVEVQEDGEWIPHSYHAMRPQHIADWVNYFIVVCGLPEPDLARTKRATWYPPGTEILGYMGQRL